MKSESIKEITAALSKAHLAFLPIKRTESVDYQTTAGRKKYNYAPLSEVIEATKKALSDNGLAITQTTHLIDGNNILITLLSHSSSEWISGELYVGKQDQAPQSEGSALTYKRRYGMSAILCVSSEEDDDGDAAERGEERKSAIDDKKVVSPPAPLSLQELYETSLASKTSGELIKFALLHGYTKEKIQSSLGITKSAEIKDIKVASLVLFPKPGGSRLVEEAKKLGTEIKEGG